VSTRQEREGRAISNLFGALPRKTVVVHLLPHWLEWLLALLLGFLVMEGVRYWFSHRKYAVLLSALRRKPRTDSGAQATEDAGAPEPHISSGGAAQQEPAESGQVK
jgi:hypothetical protein